jgi:hypothetical protein
LDQLGDLFSLSTAPLGELAHLIGDDGKPAPCSPARAASIAAFSASGWSARRVVNGLDNRADLHSAHPVAYLAGGLADHNLISVIAAVVSPGLSAMLGSRTVS